jgi:hypothetical protein
MRAGTKRSHSRSGQSTRVLGLSNALLRLARASARIDDVNPRQDARQNRAIALPRTHDGNGGTESDSVRDVNSLDHFGKDDWHAVDFI